MPGYTHLQRAVPSSTGMWFAGFAEAFIDDARLAMDAAAGWTPTRSARAAGYGVNLALDRDGVTEELGFERTQLSPIYAQNSRGNSSCRRSWRWARRCWTCAAWPGT